MPTQALPPLLTMLLFIVLLLVAEARGSVLGKWLTKPFASACLPWLALSVGATHSTWGRAVLAALVLSTVGDVLLIPKQKRAFLAGLGAFLLGHCAFALAFLLRGADLGAAGLALVPLGLLAAVVLRWLWPHLSTRMRAPVVAYVAVISLMVATAVGTVAHSPAPRILLGAILFFLSDLFVARNRFVKPGFSNRLVGLPLYFAAQILLALSSAAQ
ncbi:MAG: lysoplasmalogenase, partial [Oligoflexia bacterium]|nr:lysoplasmalogenase [Oligoflexia bacterium]